MDAVTRQFQAMCKHYCDALIRIREIANPKSKEWQIANDAIQNLPNAADHGVVEDQSDLFDDD
jgi:hypothetical protein